ncbi:hypothetical protein BFW01_g9068 [Lasiodiplodia theobromae]|nr:hypothetical protein BFW01_g9068 [Lasiodiplodia theobromae]
MYEKATVQSTAYLDGLRGIAALVVFTFHTLWAYCGFVEYGYGDGPKNHHFLQLPFIRLIHAGHAMVPIFFVVGGYVMALKPLRRIRANEVNGLHFQLAGSVFRKAMRLYIPAIVTTFVSMLTLRLGLWEYPRHFIMNPRLFNYPDKHPPRAPTLVAELGRWAGAAVDLGRVFSYVNDGFLSFLHDDDDPYAALVSPKPSPPLTTTTLAVLLLLFLPSLYLLSTPNLRIAHTHPFGYSLLATHLVPPTITDPKRFLHGLGAVLLLASLLLRAPLRRLFTTRLATAAGKRSYSLYLVHGPILHVVGYGVAGRVWTALGFATGFSRQMVSLEVARAERMRWAAGAGAGAVCAWGVAWWVAGVLERAVGGRRVGRWAERLEGWVCGRRGKGSGMAGVEGERGRELPR